LRGIGYRDVTKECREHTGVGLECERMGRAWVLHVWGLDRGDIAGTGGRGVEM